MSESVKSRRELAFEVRMLLIDYSKGHDTQYVYKIPRSLVDRLADEIAERALCHAKREAND